METIAGTAFATMAAALFLAALGGTIYVGIRTLILRQREGLTALAPPREDAAMRRGDYVHLLWWLLLSTLCVYAVGIIAQMIQSDAPRSLWEHFLNAFQKSDALHYINVAQNGYTAVGETRFFVVFFPLFPYLVRFVAIFTGGNYVLAAVLLNFCLMYAAIVVIARLGLMDFTRDTVYAAIKLLLLFPLAFFFHNAYSEPLFLMTSALSLYAMRRDRYMMAGIWGFFCALSRASGVLCAVPLVARAFIGAWQNGQFRVLQWLKHVSWSLVTLCGTGVYLLMNYIVTGNALMFMVHQREHWYNTFKLFPIAVRTVTERLLTNIYPHHTALWVSQFLAIFLFLVLLIFGIKKLSTELSMYSCAYFLMMISQSWLLSGPRYLMALFPAFFVLAAVVKDKVWRTTVLILFAIGLCVMTALFSIGHSIY